MKVLKLFGDWSPDILDLYESDAWIERIEKHGKEVTLTIVSKDCERYHLVLPADVVVITFITQGEQYSIFVREGIIGLMMFFEIHGETISGKYWIRLRKVIK